MLKCPAGTSSSGAWVPPSGIWQCFSDNGSLPTGAHETVVNGTQTRQYVVLNHTMRNLVPFTFFFSPSQVKKTFPGWAGESLGPCANLSNLPL